MKSTTSTNIVNGTSAVEPVCQPLITKVLDLQPMKRAMPAVLLAVGIV